MSKYDKELDTRTDEYDEAMKPAPTGEERKREQERERKQDETDEEGTSRAAR